ncbi:MAG: succinate dehydrogenase assembly factor 2 [Gammaproteobacteria bacterium]|nr:succinate dehydrogenase assembly factor 2 [Gammaproteobacteria bacterium]MDA0826493.1 succinate dehydrogenase assembly factor 2 [Pseudomonadota bacterium]MDC3364635.1 succinate dehydrogenase assembly factor 2 [Pseudomonadales bacterium]
MLRTPAELNRIRWRSRRGMAELDILFIPFFDEVFPFLSEIRQNAFVRLLTEEDPELWEWFSERATPQDPEYLDLVTVMLGRLQP